MKLRNWFYFSIIYSLITAIQIRGSLSLCHFLNCKYYSFIVCFCATPFKLFKKINLKKTEPHKKAWIKTHQIKAICGRMKRSCPLRPEMYVHPEMWRKESNARFKLRLAPIAIVTKVPLFQTGHDPQTNWSHRRYVSLASIVCGAQKSVYTKPHKKLPCVQTHDDVSRWMCWDGRSFPLS